ncbi:MAG: hypothetical protein V3T83_15435 [Acidobacteriota bacterium]
MSSDRGCFGGTVRSRLKYVLTLAGLASRRQLPLLAVGNGLRYARPEGPSAGRSDLHPPQGHP